MRGTVFRCPLTCIWSECRRRCNVDYHSEYEHHRDFAYSGSDWLWEMDSALRFAWISESVHNALGVEPQWHYGKTREELLGERYFSEIERVGQRGRDVVH